MICIYIYIIYIYIYIYILYIYDISTYIYIIFIYYIFHIEGRDHRCNGNHGRDPFKDINAALNAAQTEFVSYRNEGQAVGEDRAHAYFLRHKAAPEPPEEDRLMAAKAKSKAKDRGRDVTSLG
jgi:hypothetical protein